MPSLITIVAMSTVTKANMSCAIKDYNKAIELNPKLAKPYSNLASCVLSHDRTTGTRH